MQPTSKSTPNRLQRFFVSCPTGLEQACSQELTELGITTVQVKRGGVSFQGPIDWCYRVNMESRIASRVLWQVSQTPYRTEADIQQATYSVSWQDWFQPHHRIKVKVSARGCPLKSLDFLTLVIKDALCDKFRVKTGKRPTVDRRTPDIRVEAFLDATHLTLYLDTSGEPLFKRGFRTSRGEAPLRENLAAGLIRLSGWTPDQVLFDPMCGGGTILLEAAHIGRGVAPGLGRSFAFERLSWFNPTTWEEVKQQSRDGQRGRKPCRIFGSDINPSALAASRASIQSLGLASSIQLNQADIAEVQAPGSQGICIANLPYGVRVGDPSALKELYASLGTVLKREFAGWRAYFLTTEMLLPRYIRLSESRRTPLFNGALECRLFEFKMVEGSMRREKSGDSVSVDDEKRIEVDK